MKRPIARNYIHNPESIALTDMIMNLFLFFFVSFSLLYTFNSERTARMEVTLPQAAATQTGSEPVLAVTVTREGDLFLKEKKVSDKELAAELRTAAQRQADSSVAIQADESAPCSSLLAVFDACREAGIGQTSFAVRPKESPAVGRRP